MYKGLQSLHSEDHIRSEVKHLVKSFGDTTGCDFDPRFIIEKTMTDLHTKAVSIIPCCCYSFQKQTHVDAPAACRVNFEIPF